MPAELIQLSGRRYIQATRWNLTTGRGAATTLAASSGRLAAQRASFSSCGHCAPGVVVAFVTLRDDLPSAALLAHGVQPVRQVSIDGTWSALRFRPTNR